VQAFGRKPDAGTEPFRACTCASRASPAGFSRASVITLAIGLMQILLLFKLLDISLSDHQQNHWRYVTRLLVALNEFNLQQTVEAVKGSPFFGLIIGFVG
jgi:hypothetical protein